jgi:hypothetical protein
MIFEAVAAMQSAVMDAMKPGVSWPSMHELSYKVLCEHLTVSRYTYHMTSLCACFLNAMFRAAAKCACLRCTVAAVAMRWYE